MDIQNVKKCFFAHVVDIFLYIVTLPIRVLSTKINIDIRRPLHFLIVRLDHIGDVILSTPLYHSLKERFPDSRITVLCGSWGIPILAGNPYVDELMVINCPWWTSIRQDSIPHSSFYSRYFAMLKAIRKRKFDIFIDLRGDIRHIFFFGWLANIPIRVSYTRTGGAYLLTHPVNVRNDMHMIDRNYLLASSIAPLSVCHKTEIYPLKTSIGRWPNKTHLSNVLPTGQYIVIFNGGQSALRRLSSHIIAAVCNHTISHRKLHCCIVGGLQDYDSAEFIKNLVPQVSRKVYNYCGVLDFWEIKELIDRAVLFIGTDSSLLHLSQATETPTVAIYGPGKPNDNQPLDKKSKVIYHRYPCSPCLQDRCHVTKTAERAQCIEDINHSEIVAAISHLIGGCANGLKKIL